MKRLFWIIIVIVAIYYAWDYYATKKNSVKVSSTEIDVVKDKGDSLVETNNRMREDLFQVLVLMNEVTINTMQLERINESGNNTNVGSIKQQLQDKMELLKKQLAEARKHAKQDKEQVAELNNLERSFKKRESTIQSLQMEDKKLDEQLKEAIKELESETSQLSNQKEMLEHKNAELKKAINKRMKAELNAWEMAGDELVEAARIIPKAHKTAFSGKQSREITRSKQMVLKSATECYNNAIKMGNSIGFINSAKASHSKALEADKLFNLVTNYKSIGEEAYGTD